MATRTTYGKKYVKKGPISVISLSLLLMTFCIPFIIEVIKFRDKSMYFSEFLKVIFEMETLYFILKSILSDEEWNQAVDKFTYSFNELTNSIFFLFRIPLTSLYYQRLPRLLNSSITR